MAAQPGQRAYRHVALVADVARNDDVGVGRALGTGQPVIDADLEGEVVGLGVEAGGDQRQGVDVVGHHRRSARARRRHGRHAGAGGKIDHALAFDQFGLSSR